MRLVAIVPDTLVHLLRIGRVIRGRRPHGTQRKLQIRRCLGEVAVVLARDGDHFPHVRTAEEPRAPT
jgi:hypothetical protein